MSLREVAREPKFHWSLAGLLFAGTILGSWSLTPWDGLNEWLGNTVPEFLGAVLITLVVGAYLRDDARRSYVKAMRSVRAEFSRAADLGNLAEETVQKSIKVVVPAIASLYFGGQRFAHDVVALKHRACLVAGHLHRYALRYPPERVKRERLKALLGSSRESVLLADVGDKLRRQD